MEVCRFGGMQSGIDRSCGGSRIGVVEEPGSDTSRRRGRGLGLDADSIGSCSSNMAIAADMVDFGDAFLSDKKFHVLPQLSMRRLILGSILRTASSIQTDCIGPVPNASSDCTPALLGM